MLLTVLAYLLESDDVWMQQGAVVDELPLDILVNLRAAVISVRHTHQSNKLVRYTGAAHESLQVHRQSTRLFTL